jgi:hypothetical protein
VGWATYEAREIRSAHRILRRKYFENNLVGSLRMKCEDYFTLHYDILHMNNITHYAYFDTRQCGK